MSTLHDTGQSQRRHKGQTLAEFALTLPILLILTFGIIEFGRIFQAWVTLQNSARAAASLDLAFMEISGMSKENQIFWASRESRVFGLKRLTRSSICTAC